MFYAKPDSSTNEPEEKRKKMEEISEEEKALREQLRSVWPEAILENSDESIPSNTMRNLLVEDEKPHACDREVFYINARFGPNRRYGIVARFTLIRVVSDINPPERNDDVLVTTYVNWSIIDHKEKKYYRFSKMDHRTPIVLPTLIAKRQVRSDTYLMQAVMEQLMQDDIIVPDQILEEPSTVYIHEQNLNVGNCTLKQVFPENDRGKHDNPHYILHLEGQTRENMDADLTKEFDAVVDIEFRPRVIPMLDGDRGVVSNGLPEDDKFVFITPTCVVDSASLRVTRASDHFQVAHEEGVKIGSAWMEHSFGGYLPKNAKQAAFMHQRRKERENEKLSSVRPVNKAMIRLYNEEQLCVNITQCLNDSFEQSIIYGAVQLGKEKKSYGYSGAEVVLQPAVDSQFRSKETGFLFPTRWTAKLPLYDGKSVELKLEANFEEQEFVTLLAQPSSWEGSVKVEASILLSDGTKSEVAGEGFMSLCGRGSISEFEKDFEKYHTLIQSEIEKESVATEGTCEEIANNSGLRVVGIISTIKNMEGGMPFSDDHKFLFAALFSTCAYIYHHHQNLAEVTEGLEWFYRQWLKFYGNNSIDFATLHLRSFMLRELGMLMHKKCNVWFKKAVALDIAVPNLAKHRLAKTTKTVKESRALPSSEEIAKPASELELVTLASVIGGTWTIDVNETQGSLVEVLREESVAVMWRYLLSKQRPTYRISTESLSVVISTSTLLDNSTIKYPVAGSSFDWRCPGRGTVSTKAVVLNGGRSFYLESRMGSGVERIWYFVKDGNLVEHRNFYSSEFVADPTASCVSFFKRVE